MVKTDAEVLGRRGSHGIDAPYLLPIPPALAAWNLAIGIASGSILPIVAGGSGGGRGGRARGWGRTS
jgi:hypothetical protein